MLALNREPGSITDFYVNNSHAFSFILLKEKNKTLALHQCEGFTEDSENSVINPEPLCLVDALSGKAKISVKGHEVEINFYQKKVKGPQILAFSMPREVHVIRREVILRHGLESCLGGMKVRDSKWS